MKNKKTTIKFLSIMVLAFISFSSASASEVIGVLSSGVQGNSGSIGGTVSSGGSQVGGSLGGTSGGNNGGSIGGTVTGGTSGSGVGGGSGGGGGGGSFTPLPLVLGASTVNSTNSTNPIPQVLGASTSIGFPDTGFGPKNDSDLLDALLALNILLLIMSSIIIFSVSLFPKKQKI